MQSLAGDGGLVLHHLAFLAQIVHLHALLAVGTHQDVVVLLFESLFADNIAQPVFACVIGRVEFGLADFTHVADYVRSHAIRRIEALLRAEQRELGERIGVAMRFDESQILRRQLFLNHHRFVFGPRLVAMQPIEQPVVIEIQAVGDGTEVFVLQIFAGEQNADGLVIVDDDAAVAVEYFAPGGGHRDGAYVVLGGAFQIEIRIAHLQIPEARDQKDEHRDSDVLECRDFAGPEPGLVAQQAWRGRRNPFRIAFGVGGQRQLTTRRQALAFSLSSR